MPKLFTPFFTTKGGYAEMNSSLAQVRGTGLGLSVSDTIVRDHGGRISVTSAPRAGATFTVWLPLAEAPRGETSRREPAVEPVSGARIVVIDDEPGVRRLAEEALRTQGYDVASTDDGAEALRMLQAERFDLAIVDLQMPKMIPS